MAGRELNANNSFVDPYNICPYLPRQQRLAMVILALIALATAIIDLFQLPFIDELGSWAAYVPYASVALVAWWPCCEVRVWLRTGVVTSGVVGAAVAAGYLLLRAPTEAVLVLGVLTLSTAIDAALRERVVQPLLEWQRAVAGTKSTDAEKAMYAEAATLGEAAMNSAANGLPLLQRFISVWALVCSIAAIAYVFIHTLLWGSAVDPALATGLALLALALPSDGRAAATSHYLAAVGAFLRRRIIPLDIRVMERLARLQVLAVVADRTPADERHLVDVLAIRPQVCSPTQVLAVAAAVANQVPSDHPMAAAIHRAAAREQLGLPPAQQGRVEVEGINALVEGHRCLVGSGQYLQRYGIDTAVAAPLVATLIKREQAGCEPIYVAAGKYVLGVIGITGEQTPHIRTRSRLQQMGVKWFDIVEEQDGQFVMQHPGGTAVSLLAGQEVRTLRSWLGYRCVIAVAGATATAHNLLANADISVVLGPLAGAPSYNQQLLMLSAEVADIPAMVEVTRRVRRLVTRWGTRAVLLRLALAALLFFGVVNAMQIIVVDCVAWGFLSVSALRLNRR